MYSESRKIVLYQQIQLLCKKVFCVTVVKLKEDLGKYFLDIIKVQCWVLCFWRVLEQTATLLCNSLTPYFIASFENDALRQSVNSRIKGKFGHKLWRKKKRGLEKKGNIEHCCTYSWFFPEEILWGKHSDCSEWIQCWLERSRWQLIGCGQIEKNVPVKLIASATSVAVFLYWKFSHENWFASWSLE